MTIGLLLISTGKYRQFVQPLLEGVKKYFFVNHQIQVNLFTDCSDEFIGDERVKIKKHPIPSYKFPYATLYRYQIFCTQTYNDCDYLAYLDVDMAIVDYIDDSILGNIVAVRHPGFDKKGGGSWETNEKSMAYTYPENRIAYYAGGFNLGKREYYYRLMQRMKVDIEEDEKNGIMPIWQDESVWNRHLSETKAFKELDSSYCCVEQMHLRKLWGIDGLSPKIIALEKNHEQIRS